MARESQTHRPRLLNNASGEEGTLRVFYVVFRGPFLFLKS